MENKGKGRVVLHVRAPAASALVPVAARRHERPSGVRSVPI